MTDLYNNQYYLNSVGGVEFFRAYGCRVLKPAFQAAVARGELKLPMKVLDVGCGRGELAARLASLGYEAVGIDPAEDAVRIARDSFPGVRFEAATMGSLERPAGGFDRIFCLGTIEHLTDGEIETLFKDAERLLSRDGFFIVSTCVNRFYYKFWSYGLRRALARLLRGLGLDVRDPSPPRSEEDGKVHVNEQSFSRLKRHGVSRGWKASGQVLPNPKLCLDRLYGGKVPDDFPLRAKPRWACLLSGLFFFFPLNLFLGRSYIALYRRPNP